MNDLRKSVRIKEIIQETKDCKTFILESLNGENLTYEAGQFLTFIFDEATGQQRRNYSLSSSPYLNEPVSITIKRIANGIFSRKMVDTAKQGDLLITIGAKGFFTLPENMSSYKQLFLFAAGSGITPIYCILKSALHVYPDLQVVLIYSNKSKEDTIFFNALHLLGQKHPGQLKIEWLFSNEFDHKKARLGNSLLNEFLEKHITSPLSNCLFYCCGPLNYMRMIQITLLIAGISKTNIRKEEFIIVPPIIQLKPPDTEPRKITVSLNKNLYQFNSVYPNTILQSAGQAGIELPYSCETGRCGACATVCKKGNVWMKYNEVLTDEDIELKKVLTCTGYPVYGDVELEFNDLSY